jgi:hypothetical protein
VHCHNDFAWRYKSLASVEAGASRQVTMNSLGERPATPIWRRRYEPEAIHGILTGIKTKYQSRQPASSSFSGYRCADHASGGRQRPPTNRASSHGIIKESKTFELGT